MNSTLTHAVLGQTPVSLGLVRDRFTAWLSRSVAPAQPFGTRENAGDLYARAARYEATQPGFAADLRAAAEAMDRAAFRPAR